MKLKISDLNPNPYKKEINDGKLNKEQIDRIKSNIKELGLMGTLPVVKINEKYYLVNGHHRVEALKQVFGKDFEVSVTVHEYNDEQLFRGMVIENLTQRKGEFKEEAENLVAIQKFLQNKCSESEQKLKTGKVGRPEGLDAGSIRDISQWLNKNGEVVSTGRISELIGMKMKLAPDLYKEAEQTHRGPIERRGEVIGESQAILLSKIDDHEEQRELADVLKGSREQRVREQAKLMSKYKQAPDTVKDKIRKKEIDLADIEFQKEYQEIIDKIPKIKNFPKMNRMEAILKIKDEIAKLSRWCHPEIANRMTKSEASLVYLSYKTHLKEFFDIIEEKIKEQES